MTTQRQPADPPDIQGYHFCQLIGSGGSADVFLYQQEFPQRLVAVKVLLTESLTPTGMERFRSEANLMAQLSYHPSIVTIYQAEISPDRRPYIVMEYCSRPGPGTRYLHEQISVQEALRTGIRLTSAVETAHRRGIVHRDIKPGNVLFTDFGWPALTDFGISSSVGQSFGSAGMSVPWSSPEALSEQGNTDYRSDIYSLGATIYSLLAQRSPFEIPGIRTGLAELVSRIEAHDLEAIHRIDMPRSLNLVLARAMAKLPSDRFASASELGQAFQQVEAELGFPVTEVELPQTTPNPTDSEQVSPAVPPSGGDLEWLHSTQDHPITVINPDPPGVNPNPAATTVGAVAAFSEHTIASLPAGIQPGGPDAFRKGFPAPQALTPDPRTSTPPSPDGDAQDSSGDPRRNNARTIGVFIAAGLMVCAFAAIAVFIATRPAPTSASSERLVPDSAIVTKPIPSPQGLHGIIGDDGSTTFSWTNPEPQEGDQYLWGIVTPGLEPLLELTDQNQVTVPAANPPETEPICITVSIVRADRRESTTPIQGCAS